MSKSKIGTVEAIMIILTIIVAHTILSLPKNILTSMKSASILNLIYISIIVVALGYLIYTLFKKFPGLDIVDISELIGGKVFKNIIGTIFLVYFIISASMLLRNFSESLKVIYYPMTDIFFIVAFFIIPVCYANRLDFNATSKTNLIVVPVVLVAIVVLFATNMKQFSLQKMFPIFGEGVVNTFFLGLSNISAFGGIVYLYFLPPLLKEPEKMKKITLISIGITALYLILSVATLLFIFSFFITTDEITPLYNATRYIELGDFFQRLESVFLIIWILAFSCYLSTISRFSVSVFKKITNVDNSKPLIDIFGLLILGLSLAPKNYAISQSFENTIYPHLVIAVAFFLGIGLLVIANLKRRKESRHEKIY